MKKSRNARYEDKQKEKGLVKVTVWIPVHAQDDLKDMCTTINEKHVNERKELIPFMVRDLATGRMGRF